MKWEEKVGHHLQEIENVPTMRTVERVLRKQFVDDFFEVADISWSVILDVKRKLFVVLELLKGKI